MRLITRKRTVGDRYKLVNPDTIKSSSLTTINGKFLSRFARQLRLRYYVVLVNVIMMMMGFLLIPNLKLVHRYHIMDAVKINDDSFIVASRVNTSLNQQPSPTYFPEKPNCYPWYKHTATSDAEKQLDFGLFWEKVQQPAPINLLEKAPLYIVNNGSLYGYKQHQETLKVSKRSYIGRVKRYEHLMITTLRMVQSAAINSDRPAGITFHPSLQALIDEPFPFFMVPGDFVSCGNKTWPMFTFATFPEQKDTSKEPCIPLAIPTYTRWKNRKKRKTWKDVFQRQHEKYPWITKLDKAVWRGASTGHIPNYPYWRQLPRAKLVQYSLDYPTLIDAGINEQFSVRNSTEMEEMKFNGFYKDRIEMQEFQKYKAIVDIDGNSWSSRFPELLCMNSVVLKVTPGWVDYFYMDEVQPWVHYIPVNDNLTNLLDMVHMVIDPSRENQMRTIVENANAWCQTKMTPSQMSVDMSWIMASYVELLKKEDAHSGHFRKWKERITNSTNSSSAIWIDENFVPISSTSKQIKATYEKV